jgi:hypothetical protein
MPIEVRRANRNTAKKKRGVREKWPQKGREAEQFFPINFPSFMAPFSLGEEDKIFCIGSCFAREIEAVLERFGANVLSRPKSRNHSENPSQTINFNKYTVPSIFNELKHALEPNPNDLDRFIIENPNGKAADYQLTGGALVGTRSQVEGWRKHSDKTFEKIREADLIILTLGLSEVWFDKESGIYLNHAPTMATIKAYPNRFECHVLDTEETIVWLEKILAILDEHLSPKKNIILTVSPVPLNRTFRGIDVTVANSYSKAVLRSAVDKIISKRPELLYFPSYEMTVHSDPQIVWGQTDFRHINRDFVTLIMYHALSGLNSPTSFDLDLERSIAYARLLFAGGHIKACLEFIGSCNLDKNPELRKLQREVLPLLPSKTPRRPLWLRIEKAIAAKIMSEKQKRKYLRDRSAYFEDSDNIVSRIYWGITR